MSKLTPRQSCPSRSTSHEPEAPYVGPVMQNVAINEDEIGRRAMAVHEAGHQVMAVALSVTSKGVILAGDRGRSFDALSRHGLDPSEMRYWALLRKEIQILLAGEWAVRIFYDKIGDSSEAYGSEADRTALGYLVSELSTQEEVPKYILLQQHEDMVFASLRARWRYVERVADSLLTLGSLTGYDVEELLLEMPKRDSDAPRATSARI